MRWFLTIRIGILFGLLLFAESTLATVDEKVPVFTDKSFDEWVAQLKEPKISKRAEAAAMLGYFRDRAKDAVPALIAALKDEHEDVRGTAALALGRLGPLAKDAVKPLREALKDKEEFVRRDAARALTSIGRPLVFVDKSVDAWIAQLKDDPSVGERAEAAAMLGDSLDNAKKSVPALIAALEDREVVVRRNAAESLAKIASNTQAVRSALEAALKDKDPLNRKTAEKALTAIKNRIEDIGEASTEKKKTIKKDLERLQGEWILNSVNGDEGVFSGSVFVVTDDKFEWESGFGRHRGTFTIDPTKNPKAIDIYFDVVSLGIYEIEGKTLKIYASREKRPEKFPTPEGKDGEAIVEFKRERGK
jgi:uncharacterized protein (TIGR03067 family)